MVASKIIPAYNQFLDFVVEKMTPEEILAFSIPEALQERADELTERNKTGRISAEEAAELEQMMELDELVSLLKAKALKAVDQA